MDKDFDISIVCAIEWFGPFEGPDESKEWLDSHLDSNKEFNFYALCGKYFGKGQRKKVVYCGITEQDVAHNRFNKEHPSRQINCEELWLGRLSDLSLRKLTPHGKHKKGVRHTIETLEHGLIQYLCVLQNKGEFDFLIENDKKTKTSPRESFCLTNIWCTKDGYARQNQTYTIQKWIPDVLYYDSVIDEWRIAQRMKRIYKEN